MTKEAPIALSNQESRGVSTLSRRQLLKGAALFSGALLLDQVLPARPAHAQTPKAPKPQPNNELVPSNEPQGQTQVNDDGNDQEPSLFDTAKESAAFTVGIAVVNTVAKKIGLPITPGSERNKKMIKEKPGLFLAEGVAVAPPIEEAIFRLLPSMLLRDGSKSGRWEVGIPTSLAFGYMHNLRDDDTPGKSKFIHDRFPLSSFNFGLFNWKMMRERGYWHAVTAHATTNAAIISTRVLLHKLFPDKMEQPKKGSGYDPSTQTSK